MPVARADRSTEVAGGVLSCVLGLLLVVAGVLGPVGTGLIRFHMSDDALVQYVGGELVTLALALVLLVCAPFWLSGRRWAPALTAGASAYVIYTFVTVVMGQEYGSYPGNAESAFLLYSAITACAVLLLLASARVSSALGPLPDPPHRAATVLLVGAGVLFALVWLAQLAGFYRSGPSDEYLTATALFWVIKYLDLGIVIPLLVVTGFAQRHPTPVTDSAALTALGFMTWLLAAIVLMAAEMVRQNAAGASWVIVVVFAVLLVPTAAVWLRWMARVSRHGRRDPGPPVATQPPSCAG